MTDVKSRILPCSVINRFVFGRSLLLLVLQWIANWIIPDHDADAFKSVPRSMHAASKPDSVIQFLFSGLARWDAVHFLHIAEFGYTFEQNLAFAPLYPLLVRYATSVWYCLVPIGWIQYSSALLLTGVVLNQVLFGITVHQVYHLACRIFGVHDQVRVGVIVGLWMLNPASIFFTACYSESLFACLTLAGVYCLYDLGCGLVVRCLLASICFSLSVLARTNGLLNFAFVGFILLDDVIRRGFKSAKYDEDEHSSQLTTSTGKLRLSNRSSGHRRKLIRVNSPPSTLGSVFINDFAIGGTSLVVFVTPYVLHGVFVYRVFCLNQSAPAVPWQIQSLVSRHPDYVMPGQRAKLSWCDARIPLFYTAIQSKYWQVKLFGYWQARKLPCFLLATPICLLVGRMWHHYVSSLWHREGDASRLRSLLDSGLGLLTPFVMHALILTLFSLLFVNVEIITRLLFAANPAIIWFISDYFMDNNNEVEQDLWASNGFLTLIMWMWQRARRRTSSLVVFVYFVGYTIIGTIIHVNFMPWT